MQVILLHDVEKLGRRGESVEVSNGHARNFLFPKGLAVRADPSRQRETGGYGLGLYLCRIIAEAHDGQLEIESAAAEGTRVVVKLPL